MKKEICDACGREIEPDFAVKHRVVPEEAAALYGISDSTTTTLCLECSNEVHNWYHKRVSTVTYNSQIKRFRAKSAIEMANEYQAAYNGFVQYKRKRKKSVKR